MVRSATRRARQAGTWRSWTSRHHRGRRWAQLEGVADQPLAGFGGGVQDRGELGDAGGVDQRRPGPGDREPEVLPATRHRRRGRTGVRGVQVGPVRGPGQDRGGGGVFGDLEVAHVGEDAGGIGAAGAADHGPIPERPTDSMPAQTVCPQRNWES